MITSILEVDALNTIGYSGEDFVGDGVDLIAEDSDGQVLTENLHLVTLLTGDICYIDHRHIHTDITHVLGLLTTYEAVAVTIAEVTVQTVGIANRYGCYHGVALYLSLTTVANGIASGNMTELEDSGLQRADAP